MTIPTVATVRDQILSYIEARLNQTVPRHPRGFVFVLSTAVAGVIVLAFRFVAWCLDQTQPSTCNEFWLAIWSGRYGVIRSPAVAAVLRLDITGTDGYPCPASTLWVTPAGVVYQQNAAVTIVSGVASPLVTCLTLGSGGNLADGAAMALVSPVDGITPEAVVDTSGTVTEGVDLQPVAEWRAEVINRIRYRPQGGAVPDYVIWAREVPGIVAAFVRAPNTTSPTPPGDVNVYPLQSLSGLSRIPSGAKITEVQDYIRDPDRWPACANVYALAATERTCAVTITGATINGNSLSAGQEAIVEDAITAALYAAYPRQYPDEPAPTDTVSVGIVWEALVAIGATATDVTISISGIGGGPWVIPLGEIIKAGTITWA